MSAKRETDYFGYSFRDFLSARSSAFPDLPVLKSGDTVWTWRNLDTAANMFAQELLDLGARPGSHIAVCGLNSLNWFAAFFAIQKIGGIAVLINPLLALREISLLCDTGDITVFCHGTGSWLTDESKPLFDSWKESRAACGLKFCDITGTVQPENAGISPSLSALFRSVTVRNTDPCVMIFTSGSTGVPKGVMLSAGSVLAAADHVKYAVTFREDDIFCQVLPAFHVFGLNGAMAAFLNNCLLVIVSRLKPDVVLDTIEKNRCTLMASVPTLLLGIASLPSFAAQKAAGIRAVMLGGAPVSKQQLAFLRTCFVNAAWCVAYGLSEACLVSISMESDDIEKVASTVGKCISGSSIRIEDVNTGKECPVGGIGEILTTGIFLMSGYYRSPENVMDERGWLHTGDLGFLDADGYVHLAGRKKEIIIRGGENIFPAEIAKAASSYPAVSGVQVIGIPDAYYGETVGCALMVPHTESFDRDAFLNHMRSHLSPHKIPAAITVHDSFPLLASGKPDILVLKDELAAAMRAGGR